ncbi:hypothetical protein [Tenacibaculum piscium]|uniref:hypothetical protein n=1 Tax=Tenacibaculum piscium TaxID=1458515 RepID=UPI001F1A7979|nr:hypothetical protein [Tenacibaculum piscium]
MIQFDTGLNGGLGAQDGLAESKISKYDKSSTTYQFYERQIRAGKTPHGIGAMINRDLISKIKKDISVEKHQKELNEIKEANKQMNVRLQAELLEAQRPSNPTPTQRVVTTAVPTQTKATVNTGFVLKDNLPMIIGGVALIGGIIYLKKNGKI